MKLVFIKIFLVSTFAANITYSLPSVVINNDFHKQIDHEKLKKILILNDANAIVQLIKNDINLYKIDFKNTRAPETQIQKLIRELPNSPINLKNILNSLDIQNVIGLFLPHEQLQNANSKDSLFIREDAGLWTIIHEYMHFLFNEHHRKNNVLDAPKLKDAITDNTETYNEEIAKYKINSKFENDSRQNSYIESLLNLCKHNLQYVLNFSIEEIVIEEQLQYKFKLDLYTDRRTLEVDEYLYSDKYISKNLNYALNTTEYMLRLILESKKILSKKSYSEIQNEIESYESKYNEILIQLNKRKPVETKPTAPAAEVVSA